MTPMSELDAMIARGWGDYPQTKIPDNWREVQGPCPVKGFDRLSAPRLRELPSTGDAYKDYMRDYQRRWHKNKIKKSLLRQEHLQGNLFSSECFQSNFVAAQA